MNCMNKKVQRNKMALESEQVRAEQVKRTPEERAAIDRRGRAAIQFLTAAMSIGALAGQTPYSDMISYKD